MCFQEFCYSFRHLRPLRKTQSEEAATKTGIQRKKVEGETLENTVKGRFDMSFSIIF